MGLQENIQAIALNVYEECNNEYFDLSENKEKAIVKEAGKLYVRLKHFELDVANEDFSKYNKYLKEILNVIDDMNLNLNNLFKSLSLLNGKVKHSGATV